MTNTQRKNPLEEARNPVRNRIRYQRRVQEEKEAERQLKEELTKTKESPIDRTEI
jgi:hypothetical protein